jgi:Ser/Thr protein kinase RdoA (MazF antagonist)
VWGWVEGEMRLDGLAPDEASQAGEALGRIHRVFADRSEDADSPPKTMAWMRAAKDTPAVRATIGQLQEAVAARLSRGEGDAFDAESAAALEARLGMLDRLPELIASLPRLSSQLVHGDYASPNLLFAGDRLAAVLDFEPPDPFLPAYDLGRIAFFAGTDATRTNWLASAEALVRAYRRANSALPAADIGACGRVALIHLVRSLYGVREHYLQPAFLQAELDGFWTRRHRTAAALFERLDEVDAMLASAASP